MSGLAAAIARPNELWHLMLLVISVNLLYDAVLLFNVSYDVRSVASEVFNDYHRHVNKCIQHSSPDTNESVFSSSSSSSALLFTHIN
jgi:hypothetical protein